MCQTRGAERLEQVQALACADVPVPPLLDLRCTQPTSTQSKFKFTATFEHALTFCGVKHLEQVYAVARAAAILLQILYLRRARPVNCQVTKDGEKITAFISWQAADITSKDNRGAMCYPSTARSGVMSRWSP